MRKFLALVAIIVAMVLPAEAQQKHETKVEILKNEKWWGVYVGGSTPVQPFVKPFSTEPLECTDQYFVTSMMVSSAGRYLWSEFPMGVEFDGENIVVNSEYHKIEAQKGGRTLREAYLVCCHKNMRPQESKVVHSLFTKPVYDVGFLVGAAHSQELVLEYADRILREGFMPGTILIPDGWQSISNGLEFNKDIYPDAAKMVADLHELGFEVMLTVTPYVRAAGRNFIEGRRRCLLLSDKSGKSLVFEALAGYSSCLDVSSPEVYKTMTEMLDELKNTSGVDGFLFDSREAFGAMSGDKDMLLSFSTNWNRLGSRYEKVAYSPAFNIAPTTYVNRMAVADPELSWENLASAVNSTITAGLSGYIYTDFALGEALDDVSEELMLRAIQLSMMMGMAVLPPSTELITRADYRAELEKTYKLRQSMTEYIEGLLTESANTAEPLVRHLEYQFPGQGFANCNDQFMLGSKYLVVPVLSDSDRRTVRLPRGVWAAPNGTKYRGPRVINFDVSDGRMPVFTLQGK